MFDVIYEANNDAVDAMHCPVAYGWIYICGYWDFGIPLP